MVPVEERTVLILIMRFIFKKEVVMRRVGEEQSPLVVDRLRIRRGRRVLDELVARDVRSICDGQREIDPLFGRGPVDVDAEAGPFDGQGGLGAGTIGVAVLAGELEGSVFSGGGGGGGHVDD